MSIKTNLDRIRDRINFAADRAGRDPAGVRLIAVTKTVEADAIIEAAGCGVDIVGENRVHLAAEKRPQVESRLGRKLEWSMIGHLQSRKAGQSVEVFDTVQSIESMSTARALQKKCEEVGRSMPILIEINTSGEEQKFGLRPEEAEAFARETAALPNLRVEGLMTMAAFTSDPEQSRPSFSMLRDLAGRLKGKNIERASFDTLSMGMSNDFEVAIEEGATMVRIGRAVFAP